MYGTDGSRLTKSKQWSDTRSSRERCYHLSSVEESTCRELPERHCSTGDDEDALCDAHRRIESPDVCLCGPISSWKIQYEYLCRVLIENVLTHSLDKAMSEAQNDFCAWRVSAHSSTSTDIKIRSQIKGQRVRRIAQSSRRLYRKQFYQ